MVLGEVQEEVVEEGDFVVVETPEVLGLVGLPPIVSVLIVEC